MRLEADETAVDVESVKRKAVGGVVRNAPPLPAPQLVPLLLQPFTTARSKARMMSI